MKVMSVFGTRPEAIKMCPLVLEMNKQQGVERDFIGIELDTEYYEIAKDRLKV